jgi:hypothetical protein
METNSTSDNIQQNVTIHIIYNINDIHLDIASTIRNGDLQELCLSKMSTNIIDIDHIYLYNNSQDYIFGSDDLPFYDIFDVSNLNNDSYIKIIERHNIDSENRSSLITKYFKFLQFKNDEIFAKQLQNEEQSFLDPRPLRRTRRIRYPIEPTLPRRLLHTGQPMQINSESNGSNLTNQIYSNIHNQVNNFNSQIQNMQNGLNYITNEINNSEHPGDRLFYDQIHNFTNTLSNNNNDVYRVIENYINNTNSDDTNNITNIFQPNESVQNYTFTTSETNSSIENILQSVNNIFASGGQNLENVNLSYTVNSNGTGLNGIFNILNNIDFRINNQQTEMDDVKMILTSDELDALSIIKYNTDIHTNPTCNICLDNYCDNQDIILLNCTHYYHTDCIKQWLSDSSNKCPICRVDVAPGVPDHTINMSDE